jgi:hypothetical protein
MRLLLGILLLLSSAQTVAADRVISVYVEASSPDAVGTGLAFAVRERFRASAGFDLKDSKSNAQLRIVLSTVNTDEDLGDLRTAYSVVWTARQPETGASIFLTSNVGVCGSKSVAACADEIVSESDKIAQTLRRLGLE